MEVDELFRSKERLWEEQAGLSRLLKKDFENNSCKIIRIKKIPLKKLWVQSYWIQTCKKSGTWEPSSLTFLEKNPEIFEKSRFLDFLSFLIFKKSSFKGIFTPK